MSENSDSNSINTENFVENPSRELIADGLLAFFTPVVSHRSVSKEIFEFLSLSIFRWKIWMQKLNRQCNYEAFHYFFSMIISYIFLFSLVQLNINAQLDILSALLKNQLAKQNSLEYPALDEALKRINAIRARVTVVSNVLQSAQDRLRVASDKLTVPETN